MTIAVVNPEPGQYSSPFLLSYGLQCGWVLEPHRVETQYPKATKEERDKKLEYVKSSENEFLHLTLEDLMCKYKNKILAISLLDVTRWQLFMMTPWNTEIQTESNKKGRKESVCAIEETFRCSTIHCCSAICVHHCFSIQCIFWDKC